MRPLLLVLLLPLSACVGIIGEPGADPGESDGTPATGPGSGDPATDPAVQPAPGTPPLGSPEIATALAASSLRRLTASQYENAIHDIFGSDVAVGEVPPISKVAGFTSVGASIANVSRTGVETFETLAYDVADQVFAPGRAREFVTCTASGPEDSACAFEIVEALGARMFRRPLTDAEVERWGAIVIEGAAIDADFDEGLYYAVAGMLQSPSFLYRVELGGESDGERRVLGPWELASRLAFTLWDSVPDAALIADAESGAILGDETLNAQFDRMIADPKARRVVGRFAVELLHIDAASVEKEDSGFTPELWRAMQRQTARTVEMLAFDEGADMREMLFTDTILLNGPLARHYGYEGVSGDALVEVTLAADDPRRGVLTQGAFLTAHSPPHRSSPTKRGVVIYQTFLCGSVPPPPDDVSTDEIEGDTTAPTARERLTRHQEDPACSGCHSLMDPYGLALEQFDTLARFRTTENDATIDPSGEVFGTPFEDAAEMGMLLGGSDDVASCLVRQVFRFSTSHVETRGEMPLIEDLIAGSAASGYGLVETLRLVVLSDAFRASGVTTEGGM